MLPLSALTSGPEYRTTQAAANAHVCTVERSRFSRLIVIEPRDVRSLRFRNHSREGDVVVALPTRQLVDERVQAALPVRVGLVLGADAAAAKEVACGHIVDLQ